MDAAMDSGLEAEYKTRRRGPRATQLTRVHLCLGATGELRCLDAKTGAVAWAQYPQENGASNLQWAMAASLS